MVIHQSIPPRRLPPIQRQFVRKTSNPRTFGAPNFMARYLLVGPKQKTRRHVFSNQNMAGPSQKTTPGVRTKPKKSPRSRDVCQKSPEVRIKPKNFVKCPFFWAHQRKSSASIGSQTGGKSAHRSKNQPNPGLIGQDVRKSLTGRR